MPRYSRARGAAAGAVLACLAGMLSAAPATAGGTGAPELDTYLALGDSVSFGYDPRLADPGVDPDAYVGFPHLAARRFHPKLELVNASCPGETTTSLVTGVGSDDRGCQAYRQSIGDLHVSYEGSQLQFATGYVAAHPNTEVVSLMVGANDLLALQTSCTQSSPASADDCIAAGLPPLLARLQANTATVYQSLRAAGFTGRFVAVTYYSLDFRNELDTNAVKAVNEVLAQVTRAFGGTVADGFTAFARAAAPAEGDSCAAGLLIRLTRDTCDIHPSPVGDRLLATAFRSAVESAARDEPGGARAA